MPRGYFITASGTELGKTMLTAALVWQLRQQGAKVNAIKPVASGFDAPDFAKSDTAILLCALGEEPTLARANAITPWRFAAPISPHLAAAREASTLTAEDIVMFCEAALAHEGTALIEGAGGAFSPLLQGFTQADLLEQLAIPAIVVTGTYVGAISHALATIEALQARGIAVAAIAVSESQNSPTSLKQTAKAIESHLKQVVPLFTVPRISPKTDKTIWQQLPPLTKMVNHG